MQTEIMRLILYIGEDYMDVLADGEWERVSSQRSRKYLQEKKREHGLIRLTDVALRLRCILPIWR